MVPVYFTGNKMPSKLRSVVSKFQRKADKEGIFTKIQYVVCGDNSYAVREVISSLLYEFKQSSPRTYNTQGLSNTHLELTESDIRNSGYTSIAIIYTR
jgi:hypothetical protein